MSYLPAHKIANCSFCENTNCPCRKVAKDYYCLAKCYPNKKTLEQIDKAKKRNALLQDKSKLRKLINTEENKEVKGGAELQRWFIDTRQKLTGTCKHCGGKSCKDDDKYFKFSICHILPKAYFPSVATHPDNFIELCFWDKNCHGNMDNKILDLIDMNCWDEIVTKFCKMYLFIDPKERRRIPEVLLQYLETQL